MLTLCQSCVGGCSLAASLLLLVFLSTMALHQDPLDRHDESSIKSLFEESKRTVESIEVLGPRLTEVLDNPSARVSDRLNAARLCGRLKYLPAIPVLIKHIGLFDPLAITGDGPDYECISSLVEYKEAAVPAVVDAFLSVSPDDQDREYFLLSVISAGKPGTVALRYFQGLADENAGPVFDRKLVRLKTYLEH